VCSGHGGREHYDNIVVFPATRGSLTKLNGLSSITELWENLNKGEKKMSWPGGGWPRWGGFMVAETSFGENWKFARAGG
jgi:hypothetical protein